MVELRKLPLLPTKAVIAHHCHRHSLFSLVSFCSVFFPPSIGQEVGHTGSVFAAGHCFHLIFARLIDWQREEAMEQQSLLARECTLIITLATLLLLLFFLFCLTSFSFFFLLSFSSSSWAHKVDGSEYHLSLFSADQLNPPPPPPPLHSMGIIRKWIRIFCCCLCWGWGEMAEKVNSRLGFFFFFGLFFSQFFSLPPPPPSLDNGRLIWASTTALCCTFRAFFLFFPRWSRVWREKYSLSSSSNSSSSSNRGLFFLPALKGILLLLLFSKTSSSIPILTGRLLLLFH